EQRHAPHPHRYRASEPARTAPPTCGHAPGYRHPAHGTLTRTTGPTSVPVGRAHQRVIPRQPRAEVPERRDQLPLPTLLVAVTVAAHHGRGRAPPPRADSLRQVVEHARRRPLGPPSRVTPAAHARLDR